jgi:DNA-binding transcriptional MocR family regulator
MMLLDARADKEMISFGGGSPDISQPSMKPLWREMSRIALHNPNEMLSYDVLDGRLELREQIARLMLDGVYRGSERNCHHQRLPRRAVDCPAFGL